MRLTTLRIVFRPTFDLPLRSSIRRRSGRRFHQLIRRRQIHAAVSRGDKPIRVDSLFAFPRSARVQYAAEQIVWRVHRTPADRRRPRRLILAIERSTGRSARARRSQPLREVHLPLVVCRRSLSTARDRAQRNVARAIATGGQREVATRLSASYRGWKQSRGRIRVRCEADRELNQFGTLDSSGVISDAYWIDRCVSCTPGGRAIASPSRQTLHRALSCVRIVSVSHSDSTTAIRAPSAARGRGVLRSVVRLRRNKLYAMDRTFDPGRLRMSIDRAQRGSRRARSVDRAPR